MFATKTDPSPHYEDIEHLELRKSSPYSLEVSALLLDI
jgi:hypothetical protein